QLTTRLWDGNHPVRIVIDQHLKIKPGAAVFDGTSETIVITSKKHTAFPEFPKVKFEAIDFDEHLGNKICNVLYNNKIQSVIVEGGAMTLNTFIDAGLWDEARVFTGTPQLTTGIAAPKIGSAPSETIQMGEDTLKMYFND